MDPLADLNKYYWKYKHLFIPGLLCAIVSAGFSVAAPIVVRIARAIAKQTERIAYKNKMQVSQASGNPFIPRAPQAD